MPFEKAYCQYRLNDFAGALKTLKNVTDPGHREQELLAQVVRNIILVLVFIFTDCSVFQILFICSYYKYKFSLYTCFL